MRQAPVPSGSPRLLIKMRRASSKRPGARGPCECVQACNAATETGLPSTITWSCGRTASRTLTPNSRYFGGREEGVSELRLNQLSPRSLPSDAARTRRTPNPGLYLQERGRSRMCRESAWEVPTLLSDDELTTADDSTWRPNMLGSST